VEFIIQVGLPVLAGAIFAGALILFIVRDGNRNKDDMRIAKERNDLHFDSLKNLISGFNVTPDNGGESGLWKSAEKRNNA